MVEDPDLWLTSPRPVDDPVYRLFCFPYAGGSAAIYKPWPELLTASVEVQAVQLPGRSGRMEETPVDDIEQVLEALLFAIEPFTDLPFAFYGHSMGALLAFEVTKRLWAEHRVGPTHLFVAARRAPHQPSRNQTLHEQPTEKVVSFLRSLRAVPAEVLDHAELMELLLPALRADLKLDGLYEYAPGAGVSCPVIAFGGQDDEYVLDDEIAGWSMHAGGGFELVTLPGDHFFVDQPTGRRLLLERIRKEIGSYLD